MKTYQYKLTTVLMVNDDIQPPQPDKYWRLVHCFPTPATDCITYIWELEDYTEE